jgi:Fe-S-cluster containining protein
VNIGEHDTRNNTKDVCHDCGNQCCKLGGVVATKNEVDAITERGYPNHFVKITRDVYGLEWGKDGSCVYLNDSGCSIYPVRPLGCRMFPVVQTRSHDVILVKCPLASYLSDDEITTRRRILLQRPKYIIKESEHLRQNHIKDLKIRIANYEHEKI